MVGSVEEEVQRRQAAQLREWHRHMIRRFAPEARSVLEVGCGSGYVMENVSDMCSISGIDLDWRQVASAKGKGLIVIQGNALEMDAQDDSYDAVVCSFYLMWSRYMEKALREMMRVSRGPVIVMSEPVWSMSCHDPPGVWDLIEAQVLSIRHQGGDPDAGLTMLRVLREMGAEFLFGTVPLEMRPHDMEDNIAFEYEYSISKGFDLEPVPNATLLVPFIWAYINGVKGG